MENKSGNKAKRCFIYTRVSTEMQVDGYSLDAQRDRLRKEAAHLGWRVVAEFSDEGKSGKDIEGRPAFQAMLDAVQQNPDDVDYILIFKLSRFGRNTADVLNSLQFIQRYDVELRSVEDGITSDGISGKILIPILAAIAEIERDNIRAQTMAGRKEKARKGYWNGGQAPYGYRLIPSDNGSGTKKRNRLEIVPEQAELICKIYDMFLEGKGLAYIANDLTDKGYRKETYKNGKLTTITSDFVKRVLDNPVYMGKIAYGRRPVEKVKGEYIRTKKSDGEYGLYDGQHEAIIDEETWYKVHSRRLETGVANVKQYSLGHVHMLSGLLKCPVCGAGMYGNVTRKKKKDGSGEYYTDEFYYCCKHRRLVNDKRCDFSRQYPQWRINDEVYEAISYACSDEDFVERVRARMSAEVDTAEIEKELDGLKMTKRQKESAIEKLAKRMDTLDFTDKMYDRKYDDIAKRQDTLYEELAILEEKIKQVSKKLIVSKGREVSKWEAMAEIARLKFAWYDMTDDEHREIYHHFIDEIEIYPDAQKDERIIKRIRFKFPVPERYEDENGEIATEMVNEYRWDKEKYVETVVLLSQQKTR